MQDLRMFRRALPAIGSAAQRGGRRLLREMRTLDERRRRQVPTLRVGERMGGPRIFYLLPDNNNPHGGVRVSYRHVDLLNELGWDASVLHTADRFHATWFEHATKVTSSRSVQLTEDDILVVPEWYGTSFGDLDPRLQILIFNQNPYITFDGIDLAATRRGAPYAQVPRLLGIMTVSRDSEEILRTAFPDVPVVLTRPVINEKLFYPSEARRSRSIAYVPQRRPDELHLILHLLRAAGLDWPAISIHGMSETQVASAMQQVSIFLSLSDREGFGLPPAEAMACGAYVIGYTGGGGEEFFDPAYSVAVTNTRDLVREVLVAASLGDDELRAKGIEASRAILGRYHETGLRDDLRAVFAPFLGQPA